MLTKFVIDSSVIVKWLNQENEKYIEQADNILKAAYTEKVIIICPDLVKYEIGNVLLTGKKLTIEQAKTPLATLYELPMQFVSLSHELAQETVTIAGTYKLTFYDASFIALAMQEDAVLITDNIKHQGKVKMIKVMALADYS